MKNPVDAFTRWIEQRMTLHGENTARHTAVLFEGQFKVLAEAIDKGLAAAVELNRESVEARADARRIEERTRRAIAGAVAAGPEVAPEAHSPDSEPEPEPVRMPWEGRPPARVATGSSPWEPR